MNPKEKQATPQVAFVFLGSFMNEEEEKIEEELNDIVE